MSIDMYDRKRTSACFWQLVNVLLLFVSVAKCVLHVTKFYYAVNSVFIVIENIKINTIYS